MKKDLLKKIVIVILSVVSPMILTALASVIYLAWRLFQGASLSEGMQALKNVAQSLNPYLPYMVLVPALLGMLAFIIKKEKASKLL